MARAVLQKTLDLYSFNDLETRLSISREDFREISKKAGSYYEPFQKSDKARPFQKKPKSNKQRLIDNPIDPLKTLQENIYQNLLKPLPMPSYICGGIKGKNVLDNVAMHMGAKQLVTLDIKSFFPSVTNKHVYQIWRHVLNCSPRISKLLTVVTTYRRYLPQGAPTSTLLANLVLFSVYEPIREACNQHGICYSTWVDDLAFSGDNPRKIMTLTIHTLGMAGFKISRRKLKIMGLGDRTVLNGVILSKFLGVHRERLSQIRSGIHKLRTGSVGRRQADAYIRGLEGRIRYVRTLNPRKGQKLMADLETVKATITKR